MRNRNTDLIQTVHGVTYPFVGVSQIPQVQIQEELRQRDSQTKPSFDDLGMAPDRSTSILAKSADKVL
jgi:hypothetical protein